MAQEAGRVMTELKSKMGGKFATGLPMYSQGAVDAVNAYLTQEQLQDMGRNFYKGMLEGRDKLFKQLGIGGKASKNLKSKTQKLSARFGGISWDHLTARAQSLVPAQ